MKTPHKHAELIKAWADGAEIQWFDESDKEWWVSSNPSWNEQRKFRIKPEPKPDVVYYGVIDLDTTKGFLDAAFTRFNDDGDHIKLIFDGETGKLKSAEVL